MTDMAEHTLTQENLELSSQLSKAEKENEVLRGKLALKCEYHVDYGGPIGKKIEGLEGKLSVAVKALKKIYCNGCADYICKEALSKIEWKR